MRLCRPGMALVLLVALSSCYPGLHHAGQGQPPALPLLLANNKIEAHHLGEGIVGRAEVLLGSVLILRGGDGDSSAVAGIDHRRRGDETDRREDEGEGSFHRSGAGERRQRAEVMTKGEGEEGSLAPLPRRPRLHTDEGKDDDDAGGGAYTPPNLRLEEVEEDLSGDIVSGDEHLLDRGGDDHGNAEPPAPQPPPPLNHTSRNDDPGIGLAAAVEDCDAEGHRKDKDKDKEKDKDTEEFDDSDEMLFAQDSDEDFDLANSTRKYKTNSEEEREWNACRGIFPWLDVRPFAPHPNQTSAHTAASCKLCPRLNQENY